MENLRQKLKIFNYRPLVLIFLGLVGGILVANFVQKYIITTTIGIILSAGVLLLYSILHKKFKYLIIVGLSFVLGFGAFALYINARTHNPKDMTDQTAVGVVSKISTYDNCLSLLLENVKVGEKQLDYNATLIYYNTSQHGYIKLENGSKIKFEINSQEDVDYFDDEGLPHTFNFENNVGVRFTTNEIELLGRKDTVRYNLLDKIRRNLRYGLNNQNGEMVYSAMFGDKTYLNHELYDAYKAAGVAHLLAVSGLHVGLVVAIIYWILNKLKVKGWLRVTIVAVLLFCYAYLCDFSYSILRASIMSLVLMIAPLVFREYDLLSSICFAGCLIVIMEPIALFDVGAQLSFACVFGIAMLAPIFQRWFSKVPMPNAVKDGFSISLATIISTSVFMAYYFGYIQPISLISNIILLPIFGVLFTLTFVVAMFSLLLPWVCFVLNLINPLFEWLNWAIIFIANHSRAIMTPNVNYLTIILFGVWLTFVSKYNLYKGLAKLSTVSVATAVLTLQMAIL